MFNLLTILFRHSWAWKKFFLVKNRPLVSIGNTRSIMATKAAEDITGNTGSESEFPAPHPLCKQLPSVDDNTIDENFDWKALAFKVFNSGDRRPIVLFDGVCNLCNGAVNFSLDHDPKGKFRFVSLQSKTGQSLLLAAGKKPDDISSIVLVEPSSSSSEVSTEAFFKADAVLKIAKELDYPFFSTVSSLAPFLVPRFVRDQLYDIVAKNRYRFGESESCRLDKYEEFEDRFIADP